jgi:hypothetical protein
MWCAIAFKVRLFELVEFQVQCAPCMICIACIGSGAFCCALSSAGPCIYYAFKKALCVLHCACPGQAWLQHCCAKDQVSNGCYCCTTSL